MGKPAFTLDAARMFRAMKIASADPSRHFLQGVRIEPIDGGGVWMIATNGAIMLIQRDSEGHADHAATLAVTAPKVEPAVLLWPGAYNNMVRSLLSNPGNCVSGSRSPDTRRFKNSASASVDIGLLPVNPHCSQR